MTLDKIVDAYLAVVAMVDSPGCPNFVEQIDDTCFSPPGILLRHLDACLRKHSVTADGDPRVFLHRGQPFVYSHSRRCWALEGRPTTVDTQRLDVE